jgi:plastocyanin
VRVLALLSPLCLLTPASPAVAADRAVSISVFAFRADALTINPGDTVTWRWRGPDTNHSVTAVAGQRERFDSDPDRTLDAINHEVGAIFQHAFTEAGMFDYFCRVHPRFMRGSVTVRAVPDHEAPRIRSLRASLSRHCLRRTRHCGNAGARIRFTLSERASVRGQMRRVGAPRASPPAARLRFRGRKGRNEVRLGTRALPPARYRITLRARDAVGNVSERARTSFALGRGR